MKNVILIFGVIEVINIICCLIFLSKSDYPRIMSYSRGEDASAVFVSIIVSFCLFLLALSGYPK